MRLLTISITMLLAERSISQCPTGPYDTYCQNGHKQQITTSTHNLTSTSYWRKSSSIFDEKFYCRHSLVLEMEALQSSPALVSYHDFRERPEIDKGEYNNPGFLIEADINCQKNDTHSLMFARNRYGETVRMYTELQNGGRLSGAMMKCDIIKSNQVKSSWCFMEGGSITASSMLSSSRLEFLHCYTAVQLEPYCMTTYHYPIIPSAVRASFVWSSFDSFFKVLARDFCWTGISAGTGLSNWSQYSGFRVNNVSCK